MEKEKIYNIPNSFTFARIVLIIILWFLFFKEQKVIMGILIAFAFITDFFDGFLARRLKQETKLGAKFDSIADNLLSISILIWAIFLFPNVFIENMIIIPITVGLAILSWLIATIKFRRNPEYHLISNKIAVVVVGTFVVHSFIFEYSKIFLYISAVIIIYMAIEEIAITLTHKEINEDMKSIWQKSNE